MVPYFPLIQNFAAHKTVLNNFAIAKCSILENIGLPNSKPVFPQSFQKIQNRPN